MVGERPVLKSVELADGAPDPDAAPQFGATAEVEVLRTSTAEVEVLRTSYVIHRLAWPLVEEEHAWPTTRALGLSAVRLTALIHRHRT